MIHILDVSTRSVDHQLKTTGDGGKSKSPGSRRCANIDERVHAFLSRPFEGS